MGTEIIQFGSLGAEKTRFKVATVHWRAGYEEKKFAAVIPVLSASNNVPKPKNIDFQIST